MIVEHFKARLLAKQRELVEAIARSQEEGRIASDGEVGDSADRAVGDEQADAGLHALSADAETLQQVEDALRRIQEGTFGKCVVCGKPIEPPRLEAIPWTPYCLADQKKMEKVKGPVVTPTL
jgi:DnaK suppressor protein